MNTTINLRDYYPVIHTNDQFIKVSDEIVKTIVESEKQERNYYERTRYHKAYYSLNRGDGIESEALHHHPSPEGIFEDESLVKSYIKHSTHFLLNSASGFINIIFLG